MKLSMIPTCLPGSASACQRLKDPTWPYEHVPRKMVPQPTMKQGIRNDTQQEQHENHNTNIILSGDQPLQVLKYKLEELKQTK